MSAACEVWFYHLERTGLDQALPELLQKTLARGWRALVRVACADPAAALSAYEPLAALADAESGRTLGPGRPERLVIPGHRRDVQVRPGQVPDEAFQEQGGVDRAARPSGVLLAPERPGPLGKAGLNDATSF